MKHFFHILLLPLLAMCGLGSCNSIVYDEEYSKDGFYHAQNAVYFHYPEAQDTVRFYSFGALPVDSQKYVMNIPVRIAGVPQKHAQKFKLVVDTASTMKADVHYKALNLEPVIPVDSVDAVVPVTLLRNALSPDKDTLKLILRLEATSDLALKYPKSNKVEIQVTNVLTPPPYWQYFEVYFGAFERRKYLMMLANYHSNETEFWDAMSRDGNQFFLNFMKVYRVLKADPNYDQSLLPANPYNPYK